MNDIVWHIHTWWYASLETHHFEFHFICYSCLSVFLFFFSYQLFGSSKKGSFFFFFFFSQRETEFKWIAAALLLPLQHETYVFCVPNGVMYALEYMAWLNENEYEKRNHNISRALKPTINRGGIFIVFLFLYFFILHRMERDQTVFNTHTHTHIRCYCR